VALPPAKTQRAVAKLLGSLNEKIALNQRMNETLEAMARAIFKDWFVDFGPTRAKMEGRPPYLAPDTWAHFPARLDGDGKPDGWKPGLVADLAKVAGGKQLHASLIAPTGTVPVFGGAGPMGFTQSHNVQGWVITFGRVGAYCGQFFWTKGKAWINNNASLVTPKDERDAEWLFLCMSSFDLHPVKKGAAQPFISNGDMAAFPVTIPPAGVRHAFRTVIGPLFDRQQLGLLETSILVDIRDLLLPKLMSGEILMKDAEKAVEALV
jgi:type I restriction enzyme S subunit